MNKKIGLKNFRVFEELATFELKPITILTGSNSSGKSSFFKAVKLLKSNFTFPEKEKAISNIGPLSFQDEKHLGGFEKVKSKKSKTVNIEFVTNYNSEIFGEVSVILTYERDSDSRLDNGELTTYILRSEKGILVDARRKTVIDEKNQNESAEGKNQTLLEKLKSQDDNYYGEYKQWILEFNKELWIEAIYALRDRGAWQYNMMVLADKLRELNWEPILNKDFSSLDDDERNLLEELYERGWYFDIHRKPQEFDDFVDLAGYYGGGRFFYLMNSEGKPMVKNELANKLVMITRSGRLLFEFEELTKSKSIMEAPDFNSIDYQAIESDTEKERVFNLAEMLIKNGINDAKQLVQHIVHLEKKYLKSEILDSMKSWAPIKLPLEEGYAFFDDFGSFFSGGALYYNDGILSFLKKEGGSVIEYLLNKEKEYKGKKIEQVIMFFEHFTKNEIENSLLSFREFADYEFIESDRADIKRLFFDDNRSQFGQILYNYQKLPKDFIEPRIKFINKWLKEFGIADELLLERDIEGLGVRPYLKFENEKILLADLGYGINQLLPLIIRIASVEDKTKIFIEEPEGNLHPALQSKLAELFADAHHQFKFNFVIETHSEYLIRKFQYLVAHPEHGFNNTDIGIYYLHHPEKIPEGKKQIQQLEIRKDGILKDEFGKGFFDENASLTLDLLNLQKLN